MAEATPRGTGKGVFKTRLAPEIRTRERDLVPDLEDFHESEKEELDRTKVDLMEACVAWEGLRSSLRKVKEDQFQRKLIDFGEDVYKIRLYLEDTKGADLSQELLKETKKTLIILKFELGGFIDWLHNFLELSSVKRGDKGRTELTPRDYQAINENLNILKRLASREELIIDTRSKILRAETIPAARLTTKTEPIPDSTSAPATALPSSTDSPKRVEESSVTATDPTATVVSTSSVEPAPVAEAVDTTLAAEPSPATAAAPDLTAVAVPDAVAGSALDPSAATPAGPATEAAVVPDASLDTEDETSAKQERIRELLEIIPEEVFDALETIARSSELITANNLMKYAPETVTRENVTEIVNTITELERLGAL